MSIADKQRSLEEKIFLEAMGKLDFVEITDLTDKNAVFAKVTSLLQAFIEQEHPQLSDEEKLQCETYFINHLLLQGTLTPLFADKTVDEVLVLEDKIFVTRGGNRQRTDLKFRNEHEVLTILDRIFGGQGIRIDEDNPFATSRLDTHDHVFRVQATYGSITQYQTTLHFERVKDQQSDLNEWVENESLSAESASFLQNCASVGINLLVTGGHATGKGGLINTLIPLIPYDPYVIQIAEPDSLVPPQSLIFSQWTTETVTKHQDRRDVQQHKLVRQAMMIRPDYLLLDKLVDIEIADLILEYHGTWWGTLYCPVLDEVIPTLSDIVNAHFDALSSADIERSMGQGLQIIVHMEDKGMVEQICEVTLDDDNPVLVPLYERKHGTLTRTKNYLSPSLATQLGDNLSA